MRPLNNKEKAQVCMLARKAWERWARDEWTADIIPGLDDDVSEAAMFRAWRTREQVNACGQHSLTTCLVSDYPALMAHFCRLAGDDKGEAYWTGRLVEDPRNIALFKLRQNCEERGLRYPDYPAAICRRQYKCDLGGATTKQIWRLVYTVRNRRKPARK
jgi:hypothetical protein